MTSSQDKILVARLNDLILRARYEFSYAYSDFLDPRQQLLAKGLLKNSEVEFTFTGGFQESERKRLIVYSDADDINISDIISQIIKVVNIKINGNDTIKHRNVLGTLMGLGIKREKIGDIFIKGTSAYTAVAEEISEYIKYNLTKIDKYNTTIEIMNIEDIPDMKQEAKYINTSVASLRLDCIVAAGFGLSRDKASSAIKAEMVKVDWNIEKNPAKEIDISSTISLTRKGRIILENIRGKTRKGRTSITIKKLI